MVSVGVFKCIGLGDLVWWGGWGHRRKSEPMDWTAILFYVFPRVTDNISKIDEK